MNSLRPNSVCDTTPLRRFESQSSSSEPSSPALKNGIFNNENHSTSANVTKTLNMENCDSKNNVNAGNGGGGCNTLTGVTIIAKITETIPVLANNHHHNHNNNNKIDIDTNNFETNVINGRKIEYHHHHHQQNFHHTHQLHKQQRQIGARQTFMRIFCDLCILACVILPIFGLQAWGRPRERGFFCSDESLKLHYGPSTLRKWHMTLMCLVVPVSIIILVEFFKAHDHNRNNFEISENDAYYICRLRVPNWLINCYQKIGYLIFGAGVSKLTVDIAKYSIGRLRPYFFEYCKPIMADGTTCNDPINADRYIEDFTCDGVAYGQDDVKLSFPSGHTNLAFFTMIYTVIFLQKRMTWSGSKMFKHLLQFLLLMFAWYAALTRVADYRHHYTDVLAGAAIGTTYAFIVTLSMW